MKTIYLICGISGSGKSWILDNIKVHALKIYNNLNKIYTPVEILSLANKTTYKNILWETTDNISTIINSNNSNLDIKVITVIDDFLQVKKDIIDNGGKITTFLYKTWKGIHAIKESHDTVLSGSSTSVVSYLNQCIKNCIVYMATSPSGKVYIGRSSKPLNIRRSEHESEALKNTNKSDACPAFHGALRKYGIDLFIWKELHSNLTFLESKIIEIEEIRQHVSHHRDCGYNIYSISTHRGIAAHSEETKQLISKKATELNNISWQNPNRHIKAAVSSKNMWANPIIREKMAKNIKKVRSSDKQRKVTSEDSIRRYSDINKRNEMAVACGAKSFNVFKLDGTYIGTWINASQCAKELKFTTRCHISNCLHNRAKSYCGYTFKFI